MRSSCKICKFLEENKHAKSLWLAETRRGSSLRELCATLRALGLSNVSKATISRHLRECEGLELYEPRTTKIKKALKSASGKLSEFFVKPEIPQTETEECKHEKPYGYWNWDNEEPVFITKCLKCGKILGKSYNTSKNYNKLSKREKVLLWSLRK